LGSFFRKIVIWSPFDELLGLRTSRFVVSFDTKGTISIYKEPSSIFINVADEAFRNLA